VRSLLGSKDRCGKLGVTLPPNGAAVKRLGAREWRRKKGLTYSYMGMYCMSMARGGDNFGCF